LARILFISTEGYVAGAEKSLLLLLEELVERHDLHVACPGDGPLAERLRCFVSTWHRLRNGGRSHRYSPQWVVYWLTVSFQIALIALRTRPDMIHANNLHAAFASVPASVLSRTKLIWHVRDVAGPRAAYRLVGYFSSHAVAVSRWVRDYIVNNGTSADKVTVAYNGVAVTNRRPRATVHGQISRRSYGSKGAFVFGNVGQFVPWKNQMLFLAAAEKVAHVLPKTRFVLVGDDISGRQESYKRQLQSFVSQRRMSGRVAFRGWHRRESDVYADIDCLVHVAEEEPFGRVIIEAMAAGVPVIAVGRGGPAEIIEQGRTGILVPPNDVDALRAAMEALARNRNLADRLAAAAYGRVFERFSAEETSLQVEKIYIAVLAPRKT